MSEWLRGIDFPQTKNSISREIRGKEFAEKENPFPSRQSRPRKNIWKRASYISHEVSTLENFPDELFFEVFSFIKPIDLYRGFVNHNQRLNNILYDVRMCIHIVNDDERENDQAYMNYFASQIIYLAIDCHWSCLSYEISLRSFVNLRLLHLPIPTDKQCSEITPDNLPFLTNLTMNDNAFKSILFTSNSFPHLETCCVPRVYPFALNRKKPMQSCLSLRSLQLCACSIIDLFDILRYLPNLNYLEIVLLSNNRVIRQPYIEHSNISHLKIKLRKLDPDLEILLKSMPNLHRLEFLWSEANHYDGDRSFDFKKFSDIFEKNHAPLKRIDINIFVSKCDYDIDSIRQLNLQWFSSLSKIRISERGPFFITTQKVSSKRDEKMITNLLQSTYVTKRNVRFNRVKKSKVCKERRIKLLK